MRKLRIEEMKVIQIEILEEFHSFCEKEGLRYSLGGGTLLGAVRHKGYIPWDDDIDIMMPRDDFERFAATFVSEKNEILDLRRISYCRELFLKVSRKGTIMTDLSFKRSIWGVNIDVFAIDGCPDDYSSLKETLDKELKILASICPYYKAVGEHKVVWFIKYLIKRLLAVYPGDSLHLKKTITDQASAYPLVKARRAGVLLGGYGFREVIDSKVFESYSNYVFENRSFLAITDYDPYLKALYGDYMKLPPEEARVTHHLYDAYIID